MVQSFGHPKGAFCFMESGSVDMGLSHRFYGGLFGWGVEEHQSPDGGEEVPEGVLGVEACSPFLPTKTLLRYLLSGGRSCRLGT